MCESCQRSAGSKSPPPLTSEQKLGAGSFMAWVLMAEQLLPYVLYEYHEKT